MEFVLQFVVGDEGIAVSFCKFDNVVEVMHGSTPAVGRDLHWRVYYP